MAQSTKANPTDGQAVLGVPHGMDARRCGQMPPASIFLPPCLSPSLASPRFPIPTHLPSDSSSPFASIELLTR